MALALQPNNIVARGGPLQTGKPGKFTCVQQTCSRYACSPTDNQLTCVDAMMRGYDMTYQGQTLQCDGDKGKYPYFICVCMTDYERCDPVTKPTTTAKPNSVAVSTAKASSVAAAAARSSSSTATTQSSTTTTSALSASNTGEAVGLTPRGIGAYGVLVLLGSLVFGVAGL